jgi:phosphatidylglycerophosphate synthase
MVTDQVDRDRAAAVDAPSRSTEPWNPRGFWESTIRELPSLSKEIAGDRRAMAAWVLTLGKGPLAICLAFAAIVGALNAAAVLIAVITVSDIADGILFRSSRSAGNPIWLRRRAVLDPHGDRLGMLAGTLPLLLKGILPWPVFSIFLVRELLLADLLAVPFYTRGVLYAPNMMSRLGSACMGLYGIGLCILPGAPLAPALAVLLMLFSVFALLGVLEYSRDPRIRHQY